MTDQRKSIPGLMDEPPISVYPSLAVHFNNVNKAIILQQLHFLLGVTQKAKSKYNQIDDEWWVYNTYKEWQHEYFPWLSVSTIKRLFTELEADGIIKSIQSVKHKSDRRKWYAINYDVLVNILHPTDQNRPLVEQTKIGRSNGPKWPDGYTETTTETTTDKKDSPQQKSAAEQSSALDDGDGPHELTHQDRYQPSMCLNCGESDVLSGEGLCTKCMDDSNPYVMLCKGCGGYKQHSGLDSGVCDDCIDDGLDGSGEFVRRINKRKNSLLCTNLDCIGIIGHDGVYYHNGKDGYITGVLCPGCYLEQCEGAAIDTDSSLTHDEVQHAAELAAEEHDKMFGKLHHIGYDDNGNTVTHECIGDGCSKCSGPECFESQPITQEEKTGALCEVPPKPKAKKPRKASAKKKKETHPLYQEMVTAIKAAFKVNDEHADKGDFSRIGKVANNLLGRSAKPFMIGRFYGWCEKTFDSKVLNYEILTKWYARWRAEMGDRVPDEKPQPPKPQEAIIDADFDPDRVYTQQDCIEATEGLFEAMRIPTEEEIANEHSTGKE